MKSILHHTALVAGALFAAQFAAQRAHAQQIPIDVGTVVQPIAGETNAYRASRGATALAQNVALTQAAQQYAEFQARTNTTGHTADGRSVEQRIVATNAYKPCYYAENVFEYWSQPNVASPATVVAAAMQFWKNSAGHEENLRNTRVKHMGVGVAAWTHAGRHYYKVVQVFGDDCGMSSASAGTPLADRAAPYCKPGYVWRAARPTDLVCVTPASRRRAALENRTAASRVQPGGGFYGPNTCHAGYVWREAFYGDGVCVTPSVRALVYEENRMHGSRVLPSAG